MKEVYKGLLIPEFSTALLVGAAASLISTRGMAANATPPKARNGFSPTAPAGPM
jgi:hypothetical protein